ncbi:hypothetical protein B2J93_3652 [Marssonina coronariae]|uniref:Uncharacterized protein n=1 Tax=Diplocarpon coronariae TaxID=2795749 RepID=A0A218Z760_9HELO|nr:hypothetical protein B2J93_3652 [Marssonina coronariae]
MSSPIRPKATGGVAAGCREGRCRWRWRWRWGGLESRGQGKGEGKRPASNGDKCASKASTFQDPPPLNLRPFDLRPATLDSQLSPPPSPLDRAVAITPGSTCRPADLPTSRPPILTRHGKASSGENHQVAPGRVGRDDTVHNSRYMVQYTHSTVVRPGPGPGRGERAWGPPQSGSMGARGWHDGQMDAEDGMVILGVNGRNPSPDEGPVYGMERLTGHARRKTAGHGTATHRESFTSGTGELPTIHEAWNTVQSYGDDQRTTRSWQYSKPHHLGWDCAPAPSLDLGID